MLVPTFVVGLVYVILDQPANEFFNVNILALVAEGNNFFTIIEDNVLNEILGVLLLVSSVFVAFSKEKNEDELISKIRLESLVWATYFNYGLLLISLVCFYGYAFFFVMIFNMFTLLLFFIIRFNLEVRKLNKSTADEE